MIIAPFRASPWRPAVPVFISPAPLLQLACDTTCASVSAPDQCRQSTARTLLALAAHGHLQILANAIVHAPYDAHKPTGWNRPRKESSCDHGACWKTNKGGHSRGLAADDRRQGHAVR